MGWVVGVVAVVVLVASYLTWTAGRVDRLHLRAAAAEKALDAQLVRRAAAAALLPGLQDATRAVLDMRGGEREAAENDLTLLLRRRELSPALPAEEAVITASRRVGLARQVHTDLVRDALAVRMKPMVRMLRLARKHPLPSYFDVDDPTL